MASRVEAARGPGSSGDAGPVRIRPMTHGDVPAVMAIEKASFSAPWTAATFRGLLEREGAGLWVAEPVGVAGEVAGYSVVWAVLDQAELGNVAVAEPYRRQGVATALVETVVEWLRGRGVRELFLEVRASNEGARQLYQGLGFRPVGRRRGYYTRPREDALVLRLRLK